MRVYPRTAATRAEADEFPVGPDRMVGGLLLRRPRLMFRKLEGESRRFFRAPSLPARSIGPRRGERGSREAASTATVQAHVVAMAAACAPVPLAHPPPPGQPAPGTVGFESLLVGDDGACILGDPWLDSHVLVLPGFASADECAALIAAADRWADDQLVLPSEATALQRASVEHLDSLSKTLSSTLIARACLSLQSKLPSVARECFGTAAAGANLQAPRRFSFAPNEPAINIYDVGGTFPPHEDRQSLTLLVPLSAPTVAFEGGGTAFWAANAFRLGDELADVEPTLVVRPLTPGTAVLFGGSMTHAALPVISGKRHAFVSSFTP